MKLNWVLILLFMALLVRLPLVARPLTASYSDVWRQADTATITRQFYHNGYNLFYPQIYWGGSGPGYVETEFQLYPFITALLYGVLGEQVWLGRLVSLAFAMVGLWLFYLLARRAAGEKAALWGLAFLVLSPLHLRYSATFMPEAAVFCFYLAALLLFQCWLDDQKARTLWLAGAATALAVLIKPTAIQIGLIFLLLLLVRERLRFLARPHIWVFTLICLLPAVLWYWHARNLYLSYGNTFGILSGGDNKFGSLSYWLSPNFYFNVGILELEWVFAWGGALLFLWGAVVYWRKRTTWLPLFGTLTAVLYYMIVARYAQVNWGIQYHIYFLPFAALVVGIGLAEIRWSHRVQAGLAGAAILVMVFSSGRLYLSLFEQHGAALAACGEQTAVLTPSDALLLVSTTSVANDNGSPNNYQEPQIFFFSDRHGWSLPAEQHTPQDLQRYWEQGARYFVIYDAALLAANPALNDYLNAELTQIGAGIEAGCAIYPLAASR
jgi:4-amino-4-deoxy-L-arabinose transferase-like glycosyltransferase